MAQWKGLAAQAFLVFLLATTIRILSIDQSAGSLQWDEFFHLLSAESWLRQGAFRISEGHYTRAGAFTWLVAQSMAFAPGNILVARLPAIFAGGLLVAAVFIWTHAFGKWAAWITALLLCFETTLVETSQIVRFYSLHSLAFWIGSIALYAATYSHGLRRTASACAAIIALGFALHLQLTTLVGIVALGAWLTLVWIADGTKDRWPQRAAVVVTAAAGIILIVWILSDVPPISGSLAKYGWSATWAAADQSDWLFYYRSFATDFGILLYLFPVASIFALGRSPRPALFCLTIVTVTLLVHSGAGMKQMRYIPYMLPFFLIIWGLAAEPLAAGIGQQTRRLVVQIGAPRMAESAVTLAVIGVALASAPTFFRTAHSINNVLSGATRKAVSNAPSLSWVIAQPELRSLASGSSVFVTSNDLRALYFIGGYDLTLNRTVLDDYAPGRDFARDPRTGGAVIATAPALHEVIGCYPSGLIVIAKDDWRKPFSVTNDVADLIERRTMRVRLRSTESFYVYQWRDKTRHVPSECATVYRAAGQPGHSHFIARR